MKKKGFTLIELLAVIVILAIIALIATPIVMNVIENSRKGSVERSYENYLRAVEASIATERLEGPVTDGTYKIQADGSLCLGECTEDTKIEVDVSGNNPTGGTIQIQNSMVVKDDSNMIIGEYIVIYNVTKNAPYASNKTCVLVEDLNNDGLGFGDEYLCNPGDGELRTFYIVEDGDTTTLSKGAEPLNYHPNKIGTTAPGEVSLLMNTNITGQDEVDWTDSNNVSAGPVIALAELNARTSGWTDVEVNLPTYYQIYIANGNKENRYPKWLFPKHNRDEFWTSTYRTSYGVYSVNVSYFELEGSTTGLSGIRPVITISKNQLG